MTARQTAASGAGLADASAARRPSPPTTLVTGLATTPVKGLRLCPRTEVLLGPDGVPDNRRFYLIDDRSRMVNGKLVGILAAVRADYDRKADTLEMTFPDGAIVAGTVSLGGDVETRFFSRRPTARLVLGPWSEAISEFADRRLRLVKPGAAGGGVDRGRAGAVSMISTASVAHLAGLTDGRDVDPRRFRMLIEVTGPAAHEEDQWVGRLVRVGAVLVAIRGHVGRCLVTSQSPDTGIVDLPTLDLLSYRRGLPTTEPLAFGVYGEVLEPGPIRLGDAVRAL
jgi:uncharacterized protein YcbX